MIHTVALPEEGQILEAEDRDILLDVLRENGLAPESPCGGQGTCGKCKVKVNGKWQLACLTEITGDMTVCLSRHSAEQILTVGNEDSVPVDKASGYRAAFDIGTTTVVCYLLDPVSGKTRQSEGMLNPQSPYGADVLTRIRLAMSGKREELTRLIRDGMNSLLHTVCEREGISPEAVEVISVVGNPCMQQLFLGMDVENLVRVPFAPVLTKAGSAPAGEIFPLCTGARLLTVPDIGGYLGADTVGCVIATGMDEKETVTLMADIGTNGEMVLGHKGRMIACSAASGPALEGAAITFGMRGAVGAIDRVWLENGEIRCHVIGEGEARGICGSGLIDAVAVFLDAGIINTRGRMQTAASLPAFAHLLMDLDGQRICRLTKDVYITQNDIREVQLAKGAIAAGIELMAEELGLALEAIDAVELAGAFGSCMTPASACRIGLLPACLLPKIHVVGNAAGEGARRIACDRRELEHAQTLTEEIRFLELASLPQFQMCFARNMNFS